MLPAAPGLVPALPGKEKDRVRGMASLRPRESQALGREARHAMERVCCSARQEVAAWVTSPTGLCDHCPYTQRCRYVAMTSRCRLSHQLRVPMATTSPGKGQDKGSCRFSGKGTHQRRMPSCIKSDVAHSRAGSTRWHTRVP